MSIFIYFFNEQIILISKLTIFLDNLIFAIAFHDLLIVPNKKLFGDKKSIYRDHLRKAILFFNRIIGKFGPNAWITDAAQISNRPRRKGTSCFLEYLVEQDIFEFN